MNDPFATIADADTIKAKIRAAVKGDADARSYLRGVLQVARHMPHRQDLVAVLNEVMRRCSDA